MISLPASTKITITGDLGSGKSAVSRILCDRTGFTYVSTGRIQRQIAEEMGIDTLELNRLADVDPSIDERIDGIFIQLGNDPGNFIVDSRMAWFFLPKSFKVYLKIDVHIAAARILSDANRSSEQYASIDDAVPKILARKKSENDRFLSKYSADCANFDNFDLVVDTASRTPDEVAGLILKGLEMRLAGEKFPHTL
ncbi:MAG: cytidylate kinase family protein [Saprospiraceae bacterium]